LSWDIGVKKKPSAERGPNERIEIRQPHTMITPGVRQLTRDGAASRGVMGGVSFRTCAAAGTAATARGLPARTKSLIAKLTASFVHSSHPRRLRLAAIRRCEPIFRLVGRFGAVQAQFGVERKAAGQKVITPSTSSFFQASRNAQIDEPLGIDTRWARDNGAFDRSLPAAILAIERRRSMFSSRGRRPP
jgi:hypothetical protein